MIRSTAVEKFRIAWNNGNVMVSAPKILYRCGKSISTNTISGTAIDNPIIIGTARRSELFSVDFKAVFLYP